MHILGSGQFLEVKNNADYFGLIPSFAVEVFIA